MQDRDHLIRSGIIHDLLRPTLDWMLVQEYAAGSKFQDAQRRLKNSVLMWIENKTKANGTPAGCSLAVFPILDLLWEHGLSCGESVGDLTTYITEIAAFQYSDLPHSNPQERKMTTFFSKIQLIIKLYDEEVRLRNSQSIHDRCEFKSVVDEFVVQTGAIFQGEGLTRHSMVIRHRFPLKIALHNVIDNAQKHGKPGGAVIIGAQTRAGSNDLDFVDIT
ncbi:MAG: hypothetical protein HUU55_05035, partial [Myxococcales bacterium]|nr:hypothetical protein [Myxococcales bacterium]